MQTNLTSIVLHVKHYNQLFTNPFLRLLSGTCGYVLTLGTHLRLASTTWLLATKRKRENRVNLYRSYGMVKLLKQLTYSVVASTGDVFLYTPLLNQTNKDMHNVKNVFNFWQFFSSRRKFNPIFVFITRFVNYLPAIKENNWTENTIFNDALLYIWTLWQRMNNFSINKTTQLRMFVRVNDVIRWMRKGYICSFIIYHLLLFRLHF